MLEMQAVYRLAHHLVPRSQDVADLVQETYLHAFRASAQFNLTSAGMRPWLFKILHNLVRKQLSSLARQPALFAELDSVAPPASKQNPPWSDVSDIDWDRVDERLKTAIAELPLAYRTVFLLCAVEGLKYREIAEVVDMPVGTVMSRLYRARAMLSSELSDLATERRLVR